MNGTIRFFVTTIIFLGLHVPREAQAISLDNHLGRTINFDRVESLIKLPKEELIKEIRKDGIKIILNDSKEPNINSIFQGIPFTNSEELASVGHYYEEYPAGEAEFISANDPENEIKENVIIISNDANTITLIHEYMHYLSYKQLSPELQVFSAKKRWEAARSEMRLKDRFNRIMRNPFYLEQQQWRADMVNALDDYTLDLPPAILYAMSEEILIEKALSIMIKENNVYYDKERLDLGRSYAETVRANILVKIRDINFLNSWLVDEILSLGDLISEKEKKDLLEKQKIFGERSAGIVEMYMNVGKLLSGDGA